ncbi:MAG: hypothetical protein WA417_05030, partial [Stellaceae bacterium]
ALGLQSRPALALRAEIAAARLHAAFQQTEVHRAYLCPLDKADDLPELGFGPNRIARLTPSELEELIDLPKLKRISANWTFDPKLLSEFTWLMIKETYALNQPPEQRAPFLFESGGREDWGAIEPHRGHFPIAVEDALFAMLLAPWEDWVDTPSGWWRAFEVPWVYAIDNDLFRRPSPPPSADKLSWDYMLEENGEEVFVDPNRVPLKDDAANLSQWLANARWSDLARAQKSPLFTTPVKHFFVKAFLEEPLDEFLAHMLTIEAALGLESDYLRRGQPRPPRGATKLMEARVSALLKAGSKGKSYCHLFNLRSAFLHGRRMDAPIPGKARLMARRLAREVVQKLVEVALTRPGPEFRETYLNELGQ